MIDVLAFCCSIRTEAAVRSSLFSPLNPLISLVIALVIGVSFDVYEYYTSLAPFVLPLEGLDKNHLAFDQHLNFKRLGLQTTIVVLGCDFGVVDYPR